METLSPYFVLNIDNITEEYAFRLKQEIEMLEKMNLIWFIKRFVEIFNNDIKKNLWLLRGSAGSSLLLYYLGINKIDPIEHNIPLARFINQLRLTKPDIDIDLPQSKRDEIINLITAQNKDTIRMSCNLKNEKNEHFESLVKEYPEINAIHNSGVIIFSKDQEDIVNKHLVTENQVGLTKDDIGDLNLKKIDLLSNTALEQLDKIHQKEGHIEYKFDDQAVFDFICNDDGCGVTYAETPLIQYVIKTLKPKTISELSVCLAIVRPFACSHINKYMTFKSLESKIIYDDDFILKLVNVLGMSEAMADYVRRLFKKGDMCKEIEDFYEIFNNSEINIQDKWIIRKALPKLKSYGFCKAHSLSYARLIYMLYYCKYYHQKVFWEGTIKSIKGYYNDWVYIRKGLEVNLRFKGIKKCDPFTHFVNTGFWLNKEFMSKCYLKIYDSKAKTFSITIDNNEDPDDDGDKQIENDSIEEIVDVNCDFDNYYLENGMSKKTCEDVHKNNTNEVVKLNKECEFRGLIAGTCSTYTKYRKYQTVITIGYDNNKFIDLYLNKRRDFKKFKQVVGKGYYIDDVNPHIVITHMSIF